ncbi:MAG: prepilin-type N-terminal cleavage/methylation domain-containing protein [Deltaproteobacteria bacterium]|nr:prepilin-type N-terminal cleavage/methylation domain-containing protein [Deltaproteobacteria bacterium]MBW2121563.1 prepilin-type N-terminal cleavage/methylation domain-containing protein [Deltaproteobacteria bacterium]
MKGEEGFTLVEMVVAMVILAVLLVTAYGVFSSSYSALHRVNPARDIYHTARVVLDRMTEEIQSAYYGTGLGYTGLVGKDYEEDGAPMDSLTFSTMANFDWIKGVEGVRESDFLKISYRLVKGEEEEGKVLIRRQDPAFGPLEDDPEEFGSGARGTFHLADGVWGMDLRYFDGKDWVEEWNSTEEERLPRAVEIRLILETDDGTPHPFYAIVPIEAS